jgi:hypothetical protein
LKNSNVGVPAYYNKIEFEETKDFIKSLYNDNIVDENNKNTFMHLLPYFSKDHMDIYIEYVKKIANEIKKKNKGKS